MSSIDQMPPDLSQIAAGISVFWCAAMRHAHRRDILCAGRLMRVLLRPGAVEICHPKKRTRCAACPIDYLSKPKKITPVISANAINSVLWPHRATIPSILQSPEFT
jgi:hypothetical protein